jgi:peroxiredoxin family protein
MLVSSATAKYVLSVREMMKEAKEFGVKFLASCLTMNLMGIQKEEMVGEIEEVCSIGRYPEEARGVEDNLFF